MKRKVLKGIDIVVLLASLSFVGLFLYNFYFTNKLSFENMLSGVIFFGIVSMVQIFSLSSKHDTWFMDPKQLTKKQNIILAMCCFILSLCMIWTIFSRHYLHIFLKTTFVVGFFFFSIGGIKLSKRAIQKK
jgi:hypothetical protein